MSDDHVARAEDLGPAVSAQQYVAFDSDAARRRLGDVIVGQDESLDAVTRRLAVTRASLDMRPERPDGVFLFAGPTGTGKTAAFTLPMLNMLETAHKEEVPVTWGV